VLALIKNGTRRLVDLAETLDLSLPALHKHITIMERARLIHKRKVGRERYVIANRTALSSAEEWIRKYTNYRQSLFGSLEEFIESLKELR